MLGTKNGEMQSWKVNQSSMRDLELFALPLMYDFAFSSALEAYVASCSKMRQCYPAAVGIRHRWPRREGRSVVVLGVDAMAADITTVVIH
jgi:hypothetical protein